MTNVLHVSKLNANLLLISALNWKSLSVSFSKDEVEICQNGATITSGILKNKMYYFYTFQMALLNKNNAKNNFENLSDSERVVALKETNLTVWDFFNKTEIFWMPKTGTIVLY